MEYGAPAAPAHPLRGSVVAVLLDAVAVVAASLHSPELLKELLEAEAHEEAAALEGFARRFSAVLRKMDSNEDEDEDEEGDEGKGVPAPPTESAAVHVDPMAESGGEGEEKEGDDDDDDDDDDEEGPEDTLVLRCYREAIMGCPVLRGLPGSGLDGRGGLFNNSPSLLEFFFDKFPAVEGFFAEELFQAGSAPPAPTATALALKAANAKWLARHPPDPDLALPPDRPPPELTDDEQKLARILVLNLQLHAPDENWGPLLELRDRVVNELTDFLTDRGDQMAGRVQSLVWMLQNTIQTMSPSLTTYEIWQKLSSRLQVCLRQTELYLATLQADRKKRYQNTGLWNRFIGTLKKGRSCPAGCDDAFDKVCQAHSSQASTLVQLISSYHAACDALMPPTPPDPPLMFPGA
eukprot:TRINITY_DN3784_c1_g2_i2.p1 TRINITY_DN3784_c1_g2~~TRINITY_DN3784_c1_g2_i2.p1  ORF type:complete len:407 (+),score=143.78 TRINITY_DN3784_c1_g2_i2:106-1326(+)